MGFREMGVSIRAFYNENSVQGRGSAPASKSRRREKRLGSFIKIEYTESSHFC